MDRYKDICGVNVDTINLPSEEALIKLALVSGLYIYNNNALSVIKKEIKKHGLYTIPTKKLQKPNAKK